MVWVGVDRCFIPCKLQGQMWPITIFKTMYVNKLIVSQFMPLLMGAKIHIQTSVKCFIWLHIQGDDVTPVITASVGLLHIIRAV